MKQIQVSENDIPSLIEFYQNKRDKVKKELDGIDSIINQLRVSNAPQPSIQGGIATFNGYPMDGKWVDKLRYLLKENDLTGLSATEIINDIIKREPHRAERRKTLTPTISGILGEEYKKGVFTRYKNEKGDYIYNLAK